MLTKESLLTSVEIVRRVIELKAGGANLSDALYNSEIKPMLKTYSKNYGSSPNVLFKKELNGVDKDNLFNSQDFRIYGRKVNSHVWSTLFVKDGHPYTNPQLYILANSLGVKYGFDYGSSVVNDDFYVQKVKNNKDIQDKIIKALETSQEIKFYDFEKGGGGPEMPMSGSEIQINNHESLINKWSNSTHLIHVIKYEDITEETPALLNRNLSILYDIYKSICLGDDYVIEPNKDEINEPTNEETEIYEDGSYKLSSIAFGDLSFPHKNMLLKGVPGTGKSRLVDIIIDNKLKLSEHPENILRVNVHSASTNADFMRGIGIATNDIKQIEYHEKKGLILNLISNAIRNPYQPFVIVLEEIQENSLNELIGDLIYLIEDEKRTDIKELAKGNEISGKDEQEFINSVIEVSATNYISVPYLVSTKTRYRKMIFPNNVYVFCTSNYRDDKKIIEDNLLRRFEVIELYPKSSVCKNDEVGKFLQSFNDSVLKQFGSIEIHPDRFMIGHAIWINVNDQAQFHKSFLKLVVDFKDIKEVEFREFREILSRIDEWPFKLIKDNYLLDDYSSLTALLQDYAYDFLRDA